MSLRLRTIDQRLTLMCDTDGCLAEIVAPDVPSFDGQHSSLMLTADMVGWRSVPEGQLHLCDLHAKELAERIPREELCPSTWCLLARGHAGPCKEVPRGRRTFSDFGPEAAKRRRW